MSEYDGDKLAIRDPQTYHDRMPHVSAPGATAIQVWDDPEEVYDYVQMDVEVDEGEVLVHEAAYNPGEGTYIAVDRDVVDRMIADGIVAAETPA